MRPRKTDRHLPQCVYFKHGSYWYVKAGKWTSLGPDLSAALSDYADKVAAPAGGVAKAINDALPAILSGRADNTREQYEAAAEVLKRKLAEFAPHQVKQKHIAAIKRSMRETPNMANRVLSVARLLFNEMVEAQLIESNPAVGVKRYPEPKRKRLISDSEWLAIHTKAGPRLQVIMELQYLTGQRIGDVLAIRRNQLTEDGIVFQQEKTDARLLVRWTPELRATVERAKKLNRTPALTLLRGKYGRAPDYRSVALQWTKACKAAGVEDARPNDGRAKSATSAKRQGKNAQALLGHTSATMTERYLRERDTPEVDGPSFGQVSDVGQKR
jgi:integrase